MPKPCIATNVATSASLVALHRHALDVLPVPVMSELGNGGPQVRGPNSAVGGLCRNIDFPGCLTRSLTGHKRTTATLHELQHQQTRLIASNSHRRIVETV